MTTKIICNNLGMLESNTYKGRSGKEYLFQLNIPTPINDDNDALGFLTCGDGTSFKAVGVGDKIITKLKKLLKLDTTEEAPVGDTDESTDDTEHPINEDGTVGKNIPVEETDRYKELKELNKKEQLAMIKDLADKLKELDGRVFDATGLKFEDERIKFILDHELALKSEKDEIVYDD